jgi:hypothetical protein
MARSRLCRVCSDFHDLATAWPVECAGHFGPVGNASPFVISDNMAPIVSMADGKPYDSKSRYRTELRAHGCYEVGNDRMDSRPTPLPSLRPALRQTIEQLRG